MKARVAHLLRTLAPRLPMSFTETYAYAIEIAESSVTLRELEAEITAYAKKA